MKTTRIGPSSLVSSRIAYGCWRLAGPVEHATLTPEREHHGTEAVVTAYEAGFRLFDHADIYCEGLAETIFGRALKTVAGMRNEILISTKCGIRKHGSNDSHIPYRYDSSADYIIKSCEGSLERLGVETIDLFQIHRIDYLMEPEEVARAFAELKKAGKVREFGLSNARPDSVRLLQKHCPMPLVVNQVEISLLKLDAFHDGTLDHCALEGMTPLAWSPLAAGKISFGGAIDIHDPHHGKRLKLRDTLDWIAREVGACRSAVAVAWLMRHPSGIIPIIGSTNPGNIRDLVRADDLKLTREDWYRLMEAATGHRLA